MTARAASITPETRKRVKSRRHLAAVPESRKRSSKPKKKRRRIVAKIQPCRSCGLRHAPADAQGRIAIAIVAGELGVSVETVTKMVSRCRRGVGYKDFPLPVTPRGKRYLFDACEIALYKAQRTKATDEAIEIGLAKKRREQELALRVAAIEAATLDKHNRILAAELSIICKKELRRRLLVLLHDAVEDESTFRKRLRELEEEYQEDLARALLNADRSGGSPS